MSSKTVTLYQCDVCDRPIGASYLSGRPLDEAVGKPDVVTISVLHPSGVIKIDLCRECYQVARSQIQSRTLYRLLTIPEVKR